MIYRVPRDVLLQETFEAFGRITSLKVMTDQDGKSRGFGFVAYETHEGAAKVDRVSSVFCKKVS